MKKYKYKIVNLYTKVREIRTTTPRHSEGDEVLMLEIVNLEGESGWRWTNTDNPSAAIFEKEYI